jgi:hypothetical protein
VKNKLFILLCVLFLTQCKDVEFDWESTYSERDLVVEINGLLPNECLYDYYSSSHYRILTFYKSYEDMQNMANSFQNLRTGYSYGTPKRIVTLTDMKCDSVYIAVMSYSECTNVLYHYKDVVIIPLYNSETTVFLDETNLVKE